MAKSKNKKAKGDANGEKTGNGNPFETQTEGVQENQEYPTEINPFLKRPTKSIKKADKKEKKRIKKEQKEKKKEEKQGNGDMKKKQKEQIVVSATQVDGQGRSKENGRHYPREVGAKESSTLPTIVTPEHEDPPSQERKVSQTLDNHGKKPAKLNKDRSSEIQTGRDVSQKPSSPHSTKQPTFQPTSGQKRPDLLEVPSRTYRAKKGLSPVREHRSPSESMTRAHAHPGGNEEMKMYRTASISKKGKDKKKKKKLKKMFKKKKNSKGNQSSLLEDQDVVSQVVLRHPQKNRIEQLQREVHETSESIRSSVISLLDQKTEELDKLVENTRELEEKSHGFATVALEAKLKKKAGATCCGMWKKWRVCWYICACQTGVKKKKKWEDASTNNKSGAPESRDLLSRYSTNKAGAEDDDDDYYGAAEQSASPLQSRLTTAQVNPRPPSTCSIGHDSVDSGNVSALRSKLGRIPEAIRASLPNLKDDTPTSKTSERKMKEANLGIRRSSSVSDLHDIAKTRAEKKKEEKKKKQREKERIKKKKGIQEFASQYEDQETRDKVEELLSLDLDSPEH